MNVTDIGAYGVIGIILVAFAATGFFRGLVQTALEIVCLAASAYCVYWVHQNAYQLINRWVENPPPWLCWVIAAAAGLSVFMVCRYLFRFLVDPFNVSKTGQRIGFGFPAALITGCLGVAFLWISLTGIRYVGSVAELQQTSSRIRQGEDHSNAWADAKKDITLWLIGAKQTLDNSSLGSWHLRTDLFNQPGKLALCKLLVAYHNKHSRLFMLTNSEFALILNQSSFLELAHTDKIKEIAVSDYPVALLSSTPVSIALQDKDLSLHLANISPEQIAQIPAAQGSP